MRVTLHNGRIGKNGVFSTLHNDRNFDVSKSEHINLKKSKQNFYWHCMPDYPEMSFDEVEREFYKRHFWAHIDTQNQRYITQRHSERCLTIDKLRQSPRTCPEEVILQIGDLKDGVSAKTLKDIALEYVQWEQETFLGIRTLNIALHQDEQGGAHVHQRRVWIAHDKNGHETISQSKSLQEMGVERPEPMKPRSRYNNEKQVFSQICREKFIEICRNHGLEIESEPREKSYSGLKLMDYKARQAGERMQNLNDISRILNEQINKQEQKQDELNECIYQLESRCIELKGSIKQVEGFLHRAEMREAFYILNREHERVR